MNNREEKLPPVHPGEILLEDLLKPMGIRPYRLAKELNVPRKRISAILKGKRSITADAALRLARFLGLPPGFGLTFRCPMTWTSKRIGWAEKSKRK